MKVIEKYLPPLDERKGFIEEQIYQRKKIIWRDLVELTEATEQGDKTRITNLELSITARITEIDIYAKELAKL